MDNTKNKKIGAVLVQGGGIAGVQASLDLANAGFKVFLIERSAAIGGMMAKLDKTFPTGDCATCIVSPKLVECSRNQNIEILTLSELIDLEGEAGNFKATIKRYPRYIDEEKCNACGDCNQVCPVEVDSEFDRKLAKRKAIYKPSAQAVPNLYAIDKRGTSPCKAACPGGIDVQGYVALISQGKFKEALDVVRRAIPLPAICGRVCTHPCETECNRREVDTPIAICSLKRFVADYEMSEGSEDVTPAPRTKEEKVAVVGSGPAGLTAAHDLTLMGYETTIFEALPVAGGMLTVGIPDYRLPKNIIQKEIEAIQQLGVEIKLNSPVGNDGFTLNDIKKQGYQAIFIAVGAHNSVKLGIPGEELDGVYHGVSFLRDVNLGKKVDVGERVIVVGGGNVAIDAARTALRLGSKDVSIVYRRSRQEMPASEEEIAEAGNEGIKIHYLATPLKIMGVDGKISGMQCIRMELGEPDASGRRQPMPIEGSEFVIDADMVIPAIGQTSDLSVLARDIKVSERGALEVDARNLTTNIPGVFAGGDVVLGPATVIQAIAAGKRAAIAIDSYLQGRNIPPEPVRLPTVSIDDLDLTGIKRQNRAVMPTLSPQQRIGDFDEVNLGFSQEMAIEEANRCLNCASCSECLECITACGQNAIDHSMKEKTIELDVGSVILVPGFEEFAAERKGEFGFNRYKNVLTSVQFERVLSASGPFGGNIVRPLDGREARRIAWIQCVGSREAKCGNEYCSSVCCMVSTKQALVASDHVPELEGTIFYMDIRAHGKDFDQYYERAKGQANINYIRSMPSRILQVPITNDLRLRFINENGKLEERDFDLVVLSVGMESGEAARQSASNLGIELNEFGFCATDRLTPLETSRPGVFVAGAFQEPKDIPETVTQASAAASMSMELLAQSRNSLITTKAYPEEHDVTDEEPRIGVFVCHCGKNIASTVDVERVAEIASQQPGVVLATHTMYTCSDTSLSEIYAAIHEYRLNRIVVASCTPRTHEPLFRDTLREAGLNPYLFELANIRDQCSWVHSSVPELATEKAIDLVKMSIARTRLLVPLEGTSITINRSGLVIGGGVSGMTAALSLADQGFKVHLVERASRLGGNLLTLKYTLECEDISFFTSELTGRVENHPNIQLYLETEVTGVAGHIGNFQITLSNNDENTVIQCGAIIVATGAIPAETEEFHNGESDRIITQIELEKRLHEQTFPLNGQTLVFIQCAGSRNDERPYCSRVCCAMAVKNALKVKKQDPDANVFVLYRDIRTFGFREKYYKQAREAGVVFISYNCEAPPVVTEDDDLYITVNSPDFPESIEIEADMVVLSTGIEGAEGNRRLADMLKVPLNADGFFVEAHVKLRPVDFATEGIFLCGLAHSPKFIDESISQAHAAAARAATVLAKTQLEVGAQVSRVDQAKCISCMTCVKVCPYNAPFVNADNKAEIAAVKCMGCGICASECPARAIRVGHFEAKQFTIMLDELFNIQGDADFKTVSLPE